MDKNRSTEMNHEVTTFASRYWAGEAEVARTFFAQDRTDQEHLRWLGLQASKEVQPRESGIIERLITKLRDDYAAKHGDLARFASSFCEGGGASIYYEGVLVKGSELNDRISTACKSVYDDEVDDAVHGASDLTALAKTDEDWQFAKEMVEAISKQRVRLRNEQFGFPLSDERIAEIDEGKIDLPDRFAALLA